MSDVTGRDTAADDYEPPEDYERPSQTEDTQPAGEAPETAAEDGRVLLEVRHEMGDRECRQTIREETAPDGHPIVTMEASEGCASFLDPDRDYQPRDE